MFSYYWHQLRRKVTRILIGGAAGLAGGAVGLAGGAAVGAAVAIAGVSYTQQQHAGVPIELL